MLAMIAVLGLTGVGAAVAVLDPTLAGGTRPHPALTGSLADAGSILQNNVRVLAAPFLLVALGMPQSRLGRRVGDVTVAALTAASTISVGLELGRWGTLLLPYLPQLPLEWTALTLAADAWIVARSGRITVRRLASCGAIVLGLLACAAALETWATPHRSAHRLDTARDTPVWMPAGCLSPGLCTRHGPVASRSHASFPSQPSVPLGRLAGAAGISSTKPPPQGGIT
jgi:hypothetical protein